jgi:hypothetical protein
MRLVLALCLVVWASAANAWCESDCAALCKVTTTVSKSGSFASCVSQARCSAYTGGQCEGANAVAARASALLKGKPQQADANQSRR